MRRVYDIGEDGGRWFVVAVSRDLARVEVIRHLEEQLRPTESDGGAASFAEEVHEALTAEATKYFNAAVDRNTELIYSDAPFGPIDAYSNNADSIGSGWAIGFTMPAWSERGNK